MRAAYLAAIATTLLFASSAAAQRDLATLSFSPNAAPAWSWAHGSGCGYSVGSEVYIDVQKPEALSFLSVTSGADGCIAFAFTTDGPGTYHVDARQKTKRNHWRVLATYDLPVE
jgi:hypothetical protein